MHWLLQVAIEAVVCAATLFLAHWLPPNERFIEPHMARGDAWAYPLGFAYYAAFLAVAIGIMHRLVAKY